MVAAGIRGKRGRVSSGFDSPPQFQRRGPAEMSTAAMAVAGRRRPWAARWKWPEAVVGRGKGR